MYQRCRLRGILTMIIDILNYSAYEIVFEYDSLRLMNIATEVLLRVKVILIVKNGWSVIIGIWCNTDYDNWGVTEYSSGGVFFKLR